jgi:hypothetical protein
MQEIDKKNAMEFIFKIGEEVVIHSYDWGIQISDKHNINPLLGISFVDGEIRFARESGGGGGYVFCKFETIQEAIEQWNKL